MTLKGAVIGSVLQQNATFLISFAAGIVIARLVAPAEFGNYSIAVAVMFVVMALKDFGVSAFVISDPDTSDSLIRSGFGLSLLLTSMLVLLLVAGSWLIAGIYGSDTVGSILRIAAAGPLALALAFPATVLLSRALRYDALLVAGVSGAAAQAAVSLGLASAGYGALALGWGHLAGSVVTAVVTVAFEPRALALLPSLSGWRRIAGFSGVMSLTLLVGSISTSTPALLIGRFAGIADAALFSRASTVVSIILSAFFFAVTRPMLPRLSEAERESDGLAPVYLRVIACVTGLAWPAYAALCVWADPIILALYGPSWAASAGMIAPIALGQALTLAVAPHHDVLIVKRRQRLLLLSETAVLCVIAALLGAALWAGVRSHQAVWALTAGGVFFAIWYFVALRRIVGFAPAAIALVWSRSLVATLAVLPSLVAFRLASDAGVLPLLPAFIMSGLIAATFWLAALRACRHELFAQIQPLLPATSMGAHRRSVFSRRGQ